ncbi:hypothetical protein [Kitasatospora sp. NPDC004272]
MTGEMLHRSYRGLLPWPELLHGRPTIVYPAGLGALPPSPADGWRGQHDFDNAADPHPGWSILLDGENQLLRTTGPSGLWYQGSLAVTRDWRRTAHRTRQVLQITGNFTTPLDFPAAARTRALLFCTSTLTFIGDTW